MLGNEEDTFLALKRIPRDQLETTHIGSSLSRYFRAVAGNRYEEERLNSIEERRVKFYRRWLPFLQIEPIYLRAYTRIPAIAGIDVSEKFVGTGWTFDEYIEDLKKEKRDIDTINDAINKKWNTLKVFLFFVAVVANISVIILFNPLYINIVPISTGIGLFAGGLYKICERLFREENI